ncbi:MAG: hypothetical protein HC887_12365 [Desulfobacteraceae bacterium]|nr:hypothetical protein [Desulfobacteraceae bacterium]
MLMLNPEAGYADRTPVTEEVDEMLHHIVREDAIADMMMKSLDNALKASAQRGAERIRHILEGHARQI